MRLLATLFTFNTFLLFDPASCFTQVPSKRVGRPSNIEPRFVTIYTPDGMEFEDDDRSPTVSAFGSYMRDNHSLMDMISTDAAAELARLAVAFCPPDQALELEEIASVNVLSVDTSHITIEAVLCETDGCVTLAIPVSFPTPCDDQDFTQCVIENVSRLDFTANESISANAINKNNYEDLEHNRRTLATLMDSRNIDLPIWWETQDGLLGECEHIRSLLNEADFLPDVKELAEHSLVVQHDDWNVKLAAVALVGPAGMILRAEVLDQARRQNLISIPVPFGKTCRTVESLRAVVLGIVAAAAADLPDEALVTPAVSTMQSEPIISADDIF